MQGKYFYREAMKQWLTQEYSNTLPSFSLEKCYSPNPRGETPDGREQLPDLVREPAGKKKQDNLEELWERRVAKSSPKMFIWLFKKFPAIRGTPSDFE